MVEDRVSVMVDAQTTWMKVWKAVVDAKMVWKMLVDATMDWMESLFDGRTAPS